MKKISEIISKRPLKRVIKPARHGNPMYGIALDLQREFGITLPMCFKLLKQYRRETMIAVRTWWKDYPFKRKNNIGLLIWKLKQTENETQNDTT